MLHACIIQTSKMKYKTCLGGNPKKIQPKCVIRPVGESRDLGQQARSSENQGILNGCVSDCNDGRASLTVSQGCVAPWLLSGEHQDDRQGKKTPHKYIFLAPH